MKKSSFQYKNCTSNGNREKKKELLNLIEGEVRIIKTSVFKKDQGGEASRRIQEVWAESVGQ